MAIIKPFKGYLYNTESIKDISSVLAPPYDVISPEMQTELYSKSDYNMVRLILGKDEDGPDSRYKKAKAILDDFIKRDILTRDKEPCIYVYDQEYEAPEGRKNRTGFIGLMKLEDPNDSKVLPHEHTFSNPKKDRLKLIKSVRANLSLIFTIFDDEGEKVIGVLDKVSSGKPLYDVDYEGVRQRLWRISDVNVISKIQETMKGKQVFIADGHHRYETALAYRDYAAQKTKRSGEQPHDYAMMYFAPLIKTRLTILATHRVIKDAGGLSSTEMLGRLSQCFDIEKIKSLKDLTFARANRSDVFSCGIVTGKKDYYILRLKDSKDVDNIISVDKSKEWKRLDVTVLHHLILEHILKIKEKDGNIAYTRDAKWAVSKVDSGQYACCFLLDPTGLHEVRQIASKGEKMPHKSTFFYPKLLSGIVINKFD